MHVYLVTIKKTYFGNDKYIETNAQALDALKHSLSKVYLSMISHCDFTFAVWNTLTSPELQNPWWMSETKLAIWSKGLTPLRYIWILI